MDAQAIWQELGPGIALFNLLAFYPAPTNPAIQNVVAGLLAPEFLSDARQDLIQLQQRLLALPAGSGPVPERLNFSQLPDSAMRQLLDWLSQLDALYRGRLENGQTAEIEAALRSRSAPDVGQLQRAISEFHQLKAAAV